MFSVAIRNFYITHVTHIMLLWHSSAVEELNGVQQRSGQEGHDKPWEGLRTLSEGPSEAEDFVSVCTHAKILLVATWRADGRRTNINAVGLIRKPGKRLRGPEWQCSLKIVDFNGPDPQAHS